MSTKSQIYFLDPNGMQIGWQSGTGPNGEATYLPAQLTVPRGTTSSRASSTA